MSTNIDIRITDRCDNWLTAMTVYRNREYLIKAKVFYIKGVPSNTPYGVKGGKMYKLWIKNVTEDKVIFDYDRGFNVGNKASVEKGVAGRIITELETMLSTGSIDPFRPFGYFDSWIRS